MNGVPTGRTAKAIPVPCFLFPVPFDAFAHLVSDLTRAIPIGACAIPIGRRNGTVAALKAAATEERECPIPSCGSRQPSGAVSKRCVGAQKRRRDAMHDVPAVLKHMHFVF